MLLNRYGPGIFQKSYKVTNSMDIWFSIECNGGTQVDDFLDVESQKRFTAISIISYLASLWSCMSIWWLIIEISAQNLLHRVSILTVGRLVEAYLLGNIHKLSGVTTPYTCCTTPYTISLLRKIMVRWLKMPAKNNTVHFRPCDLMFLLCPLLYGVVTPDSMIHVISWLFNRIKKVLLDIN